MSTYEMVEHYYHALKNPSPLLYHIITHHPEVEEQMFGHKLRHYQYEWTVKRNGAIHLQQNLRAEDTLGPRPLSSLRKLSSFQRLSNIWLVSTLVWFKRLQFILCYLIMHYTWGLWWWYNGSITGKVDSQCSLSDVFIKCGLSWVGII